MQKQQTAYMLAKREMYQSKGTLIVNGLVERFVPLATAGSGTSLNASAAAV